MGVIQIEHARFDPEMSTAIVVGDRRVVAQSVRQDPQQLLRRRGISEHSLDRAVAGNRSRTFDDAFPDLFSDLYRLPCMARGAAFFGRQPAAFVRTPLPWSAPTG